MRLFIATFFLIAAFLMTMFLLTMTTMLAFVVAFRLRWRPLTQRQESVDRHSTKTIVDAEYTVVEK